MKKNKKDRLIQVLIQMGIVLINNGLFFFNSIFWTSLQGLDMAREIIAKSLDEKERREMNEKRYRDILDILRCQPEIKKINLAAIPDRIISFVCKTGTYLFKKGKVEKVMTKEEAKKFYHTWMNYAAYDESIAHDVAGNWEKRENYIREKCPAFFEYVLSIFGKETAAALDSLFGMFGYLFSNLTGAKGGFFLIGAPNSGKSTVLHLVEHILGAENVSHISLEELREKFSIAELANKHVNICGEISQKIFRGIETYKRLTGGDSVKGEFKGQALFEFVHSGRFLIAGNRLPDFGTDGADAMLERMYVLYFPTEVEPEKRDPNLLNRLLEEMDAIFTISMLYAAKMAENGFSFTTTEKTQEILKEYKSSFHIHEDFLESCCETGTGEEYKVYKKDLWTAYMDYCQENGYKTELKQKSFYAAIARAEGVKSGKGRIDGGKSLALFMGLRLKVESLNGEDGQHDLENN